MRTELADLKPVIALPAGTLIRYAYRLKGSDVSVTGRKGAPVNPGPHSGFEVLDDQGRRVGRVTGNAWVEVLGA